MKRVIAAFIATVAGLVLLLGFKIGPAKPAAQPLATTGAAPDSSTGAAPDSSPAPTASGTSKAAASTTVTGSTVSVGERGQIFGSVQVRVTLVSGKITAVTEVQVPDNDPRSSQISQFAIPVLRAETLKAQGAGIDVVSGATYTSEAYATSVQAALDSAKS